MKRHQLKHHFTCPGLGVLLTWSLPQTIYSTCTLWKVLLLYLGHFSSIFNSVSSSESPPIVPVHFP